MERNEPTPAKDAAPAISSEHREFVFLLARYIEARSALQEFLSGRPPEFREALRSLD